MIDDEFIMDLCNKSIILHDLLNHEISMTCKCPDCNETSVSNPTHNYILPLSLPTTNEILGFQDIINFNIGSWNASDIVCKNKCLHTKIEKVELRTDNKLLMLQLKLFYINKCGELSKINNLRIKHLPEEVVLIHNRQFKSCKCYITSW